MAFIKPSRSDVHVDRTLTNVSLAFIQAAEGFVASRAFPRLPVSHRSDQYFTYDRGYWNRAEMQKRAPGTESAGSNYDLSTASYSCDVWALHRDIDDQVRSNADAAVQLDRESVEYLTLQNLLRQEKEWADNFFTQSVWATDSTPSTLWDAANSTPLSDVRTGVRTVQESTGFRPNRMVIGRAVYDALLDNDEIVGRLNRGQTSGPAMVMRQNLAELFEMDEILVMDAIENTAAEGATNSHSFIGGKHCLLLYAPSSPGLMTPSAGYTFTWNGLLGGGSLGTNVRRMRMEHLSSDRLEIQSAFDQKLVSSDLGYLIDDAVS